MHIAGIQSLSLQCLAKLSAADPLLSQVVVSCGILDSVLASMAHEFAPVQASASEVLSAVSGAGTEFAKKVLKAGVCHVLMSCCRSILACGRGDRSGVQACQIGTCQIASCSKIRDRERTHPHSPFIATRTTYTGVMPTLLVNLQSSNLEVKEGAVNTLATLINSSPEHAALVCTEHVLGILVTLLQVQVCAQADGSMCVAY